MEYLNFSSPNRSQLLDKWHRFYLQDELPIQRIQLCQIWIKGHVWSRPGFGQSGLKNWEVEFTRWWKPSGEGLWIVLMWTIHFKNVSDSLELRRTWHEVIYEIFSVIDYGISSDLDWERNNFLLHLIKR